ncbi:MAG: DUF5689 domain-containing protein [Bacteroidales bacterium]
MKQNFTLSRLKSLLLFLVTICFSSVAVAQNTVSLPFSFDAGIDDLPNGCTQVGIGSDYKTSPKLKFDHSNDKLEIALGQAAETLSFSIKWNAAKTTDAFTNIYTIEESTNGTDYTPIVIFNSDNVLVNATVKNYESKLQPASRYIRFSYTEKKSGNIALGKIGITPASTSSLSIPTFNLIAPEGYLITDPIIRELGYVLAIENSNEKGNILYSVTEAEPALEYSEPIDLTELTTIKAKVVDGTEESEVVTYKVNALNIERITMDGLLGLLSGDMSKDLYSGALNAYVQLLFNNGIKYYLTLPETDVYTLVYSEKFLPTDAKAGDIFNTNFICKFDEYQSTPQIVSVQHFAEPQLADNVEYSSKEVKINDILNDYKKYQHNFITIKGVSFQADHTYDPDGKTADRTATVTDADNKVITIYDSFKTVSATVSKDKKYDITGFVGRLGDAIQIFPRSNDDIVENTGTGINEATAANLTINATKGGVIINAAEATAISIYTIAGQLVKTTTVEAGSTLINLPAGVYVIAGSKVVIL